MSVTECLQRAQRMLASGAWMVHPCWNFARSEIWDSTSPGQLCSRDDEEVAFYTVDGALQVAARDAAELNAARERLERLAAPAAAAEAQFFGLLPAESGTAEWWGLPENAGAAFTAGALVRASAREGVQDLDGWVAKPGRTLKQVLALFDWAIAAQGAEVA